MSVQDRRRGAVTARALGKLSDNDVSFLLRHSPKVGRTSLRYTLLPNGSKIRFPRVLADEAYQKLKSILAKNPGKLSTIEMHVSDTS